MHAQDDYDHLRESADQEQVAEAEAQRMRRERETPHRKLAEKAVSEQWAKNMNETYGPFEDEPSAQRQGIRAYEPDDMIDSTIARDGEPIGNRAPMATDLVQFVLWLRADTDYFEGPNADQHHPKHDDPDFYEVLAQNALEYTGE